MKAKEGTHMEELPEVSLIQKSDFIPAIERGFVLGAVTGCLHILSVYSYDRNCIYIDSVELETKQTHV